MLPNYDQVQRFRALGYSEDKQKMRFHPFETMQNQTLRKMWCLV